jgi:hypothetical protein
MIPMPIPKLDFRKSQFTAYTTLGLPSLHPPERDW